MRLICPSCNAQYEVDDSVIPETGRDVQCSSCGHTWYQMPAAHGRGASSEQPPVEEEAETAPAPKGHTSGEPPTAAEAISDIAAAEEDPNAEFYEEIIEEETVIGIITPGASLPADDEIRAAESEGEPEEAAAEEPPLPEREVDPSVLSILREEAEAEIRQRQIESGEEAAPADPEIETSGEITRQSEALGREVRPAEAEDASASRRDLLPDVEEINSTLQQAETPAPREMQDDAAAAETARTQRRRGWRLGFSLVLFLLAIAIIVYVYADVLGERFPGLKPAISAYVEQVNALRFRIDALMEKATDMLTEKAAPQQE